MRAAGGAQRARGRALAVLLATTLALLAGCHRLEVGPPVAGGERQALLDRFFRLAAPPAGCAALDADLTVSAPSWFGRRIFSGYLQAQEPAFAKIVLLAPLGQPLALFATDGRTYQYVDTPRRRMWRGRMTDGGAAALYALLTGRPVGCAGEPLLREVRRRGGPADSGYLIAYQCRPDGPRYEYWFDGRTARVRRVRLLANGAERPLFTVTYASYQQVEAASGVSSCQVPARLRLALQRGVVDITLDDPASGQVSGPADFRIAVPAGYAVEEGPAQFLGAGG